MCFRYGSGLLCWIPNRIQVFDKACIYRGSLQPSKSQKRTSSASKHEISWFFSTFVGPFCPPGSGSRFRIRIHWPDWIRIQSGSKTLMQTCSLKVSCWMLMYSTNAVYATLWLVSCLSVWIKHRVPGTEPEINLVINQKLYWNQYLGSGSGLDPDSIRSVDPYPDLESGSRSRKKMTQKNRKKSEISCFAVLDFLFWGLKTSTA